MTIETKDIDVTLDEAIMKDEKCVGYITSGGYAHYVKKSMAMGYVPNDLAMNGTELNVEINGNLYKAKIQLEPLYDPRGTKMRS
jgi:dimethylglycine dehydrogenase